jgi:glycerophosphoryl diester phosphodiesterase
MGLTVESTIASFTKALQIGVTTLEVDVQITQDGAAVVTMTGRSARPSAQILDRSRRLTPNIRMWGSTSRH